MATTAQKGIEVDFSFAPICLLRYPAEVKPEHFSAMFEEVRAGREPNREYALLIDMSRFNPLSLDAAARKEASRLTRQSDSEHADRFVCEARVVASGVARAIVTTYDWITPLPWPRHNFATGAVAENWVRARLEAAGIPCQAKRIWGRSSHSSP